MLVLEVFRRDSLARCAVSYLNRLKSMILQTGGLASGATSTRSRSIERAMDSASGSGLTPSCVPSESMRRTSRARMRSLIRWSPWSAAAAMRHHSFVWPPVRAHERRASGSNARLVDGHPTRTHRLDDGRVGAGTPLPLLGFHRRVSQ